jgi:hypothetical protein
MFVVSAKRDGDFFFVVGNEDVWLLVGAVEW